MPTSDDVEATQRTISNLDGRNESREEGSEAYELALQPVSVLSTSNESPALPESPEAVRKRREVQFAAFTALSWVMFMQGWNDGTNGPLLPAMQRHYKVGMTRPCTVSERLIRGYRLSADRILRRITDICDELYRTYLNYIWHGLLFINSLLTVLLRDS